MSQDYSDITEDTTLRNSRQIILDRDDALNSNFAGSEKPVGSYVKVGMTHYDDVELKFYVLESLTPVVWREIPLMDSTSGSIVVSNGGTGASTPAGARANLGLDFTTTEIADKDILEIVSGGTGANNSGDARSNLGIVLNVSNSTLPVGSGGTGQTSIAAFKTTLGLGALAYNDNVQTGSSLWGAANFTEFFNSLGLNSAATKVAGSGAGNVLLLEGTGTGSINSDVFTKSINSWGVKNMAKVDLHKGTTSPPSNALGEDGDIYLQY